MDSYCTRNSGQTRTNKGCKTSAFKAIPKTFTASSPRSSITTTETTTTFINRVNRRGPAYRPPAPPKFLQRTEGLMRGEGREKVKTAADEKSVPKKSVPKISTIRKLPNRSESKRQTRQPEEEKDPATTLTESTEDQKESEETKVEPKIRRIDHLVYRSKNCTFDQNYLDVLTFDPAKEDLLTLSPFDDDEEGKEEAPKVVVPRKKTFKPYVKKEQSAGFGFWTSGLEDSLLSASGFSYKPAGAKKPMPKRTNNYLKPKDSREQKDAVSESTLRTAMTSSPLFF